MLDHSHRLSTTPVASEAVDHYPPIGMSNVNKIMWIAEQLVHQFGIPEIEILDPLENLVLTILSQNTNDHNRDRAFASLMGTFATFEEIRLASLPEIAAAIQVGGLQQQKSRSIRHALETIVCENGELDLSFLNNLSLPEALSWLTTLPGVGPKTAGIVLLFSFKRPYFPADTHIRRIMSRMGLVSGKSDPHARLNKLLPPDVTLMQQLHLLAIRLGREVCHPRAPQCGKCVLHPRCPWAQSHGSLSEDGVTSRIERGGNH